MSNAFPKLSTVCWKIAFRSSVRSLLLAIWFKVLVQFGNWLSHRILLTSQAMLACLLSRNFIVEPETTSKQLVCAFNW